MWLVVVGWPSLVGRIRWSNLLVECVRWAMRLESTHHRETALRRSEPSINRTLPIIHQLGRGTGIEPMSPWWLPWSRRRWLIHRWTPLTLLYLSLDLTTKIVCMCHVVQHGLRQGCMMSLMVELRSFLNLNQLLVNRLVIIIAHIQSSVLNLMSLHW